ncbi:extracellular solute-binding protein, partial [Patescibacteria group bacterium]|nr:extracellular solute-binding protein [Patescibacteria group bacterium]
MQKQKIQKFISVLMVIALVFVTTGCLRTKEVAQTTTYTDKIELTYYKLFDDSDVIEPLIQAYQAERPNIKIKYRKFTDTQEYYDLILNELAEGEGPDIFSVPNTWFAKNYKKVSPLPTDMMTPATFEDIYVAVTYDDLVRPDPATGENKIYGFPMTVDTLALYYNKDQFEDAIPERGKPATTWDGIKEDVYKLTKKDNSFERFEVSGMAMGFANNISRAVDILYLLIIQQNGKFYDDGYIKSIFASSQGVASDGSTKSIGASALELYSSFVNSANKNYSWNAYLANENTDSKEITTFARGKVSM